MLYIKHRGFVYQTELPYPFFFSKSKSKSLSTLDQSLVPARWEREAARAAAAVFGAPRWSHAAAGPSALQQLAHPSWAAGGLLSWDVYPAAHTYLLSAKRKHFSRALKLSWNLVEFKAIWFYPVKAEHEKEEDNQLACLLRFWRIIQHKHSLTFCCSRWKAWQQSRPPCKTCTGNGSWSQSFPSRRRCRWSSASLVSPGVCSGSSCPRRRSPGKWRSCWTAAKTCRFQSRSCADLHSGRLNGETPSCLLLQVCFRDQTTKSAKRQTDSSFKPGLRRWSRPASCSEAWLFLEKRDFLLSGQKTLKR